MDTSNYSRLQHETKGQKEVMHEKITGSPFTVAVWSRYTYNALLQKKRPRHKINSKGSLMKTFTRILARTALAIAPGCDIKVGEERCETQLTRSSQCAQCDIIEGCKIEGCYF